MTEPQVEPDRWGERLARRLGLWSAVAVVIGAAFGAIVNSFVNDLLMPPIGLALGRVNFADLFVTLSGQSYPSLAAANPNGIANAVPTNTNQVSFNILFNY